MIRAEVLADSHGRILRDLRVSITDRCNFRCLYCLPETEAAQNFYRGHWARLPNSAPIVQQWVPKSAILSFEEIERVVASRGLGIRKTAHGRRTAAPDLEQLVAPREFPARGPRDDDESFLFPQRPARSTAGLHRVTFSLDSLDRANFKNHRPRQLG
jgi:cyclic pyranopterin phosphate synthase